MRSFSLSGAWDRSVDPLEIGQRLVGAVAQPNDLARTGLTRRCRIVLVSQFVAEQCQRRRC